MSKKSGSIFVYLILALSSLVVFWRVHTYDFIHYDDPSYVTDNPYVKAGLTRVSIAWAFTTPHGGTSYWHPLTWMSHMLDCELYGLEAGGHHLTNLLLHIINTLLLFAIFKRMTGAVWKSGFVAALFAIHPLHVESVVWISERKDVLSTFFCMLTIGAYLHYIRRPGVTRYLLVFLFFVLGLMSKPMVVTLPFVLLLLDYWPLERFQKGRVAQLVLEKMPLFILSVILCIVTFVVQRSIGAITKIGMLPIGNRITNTFISYVTYPAKMIWPSRLAIFYPHRVGNIPMWQWAGAAVLLILLLVLVIRLAPKRKYLLTGWLWYLGTLVPVIGIVQVGSQAMADRYSYIPLTGLFIIIAWGAAELLAKWEYRKTSLGISATAVILVLSICSWFQVGYWRSSVSIFEHSLKVTGGNSVTHYILANSLQFAGRSDEAIAHYYKALSFNPDYTNARCNLANTLKEQGRIDEAIGHYRQVLQAEPGDAVVHNNLANALQSQGKLDGAVEHYRKALEVKPGLFEGRVNLGLALKATEQFDDALEQFREAARLNPNHPLPFNNMAQILLTYPDEKMRNANQAIVLAERAVEITGQQNVFALDTLAAAYAAAGKFDKAIEAAEKALGLATTDQNEELADGLHKKLQHYRQGVQ